MPRTPRPALAAALCVALAVLPATAPARQSDPAAGRTLFVTVTDADGNFIKGLRKEDFVVLDGKRRHAPASLSAADGPATVALVFDLSEALDDSWRWVAGGAKGRANVREALAHFLSRGHPDNEYLVVAFDRRPQPFAEPAAAPGDVLAAFERAGAARSRPNTSFFDAFRLALERVRGGRHARRVVVALTDALDSLSSHDFSAVRRAVEGSEALVYCVGLRTAPQVVERWNPVMPPRGPNAYPLLVNLSLTSGGAAFFPRDPRSLLAAADLLAAELRSQYALNFTAGPAEKRDGWHELKVTLNDLRDERGRPVKFEVRARKGFYDAAAPSASR